MKVNKHLKFLLIPIFFVLTIVMAFVFIVSLPNKKEVDDYWDQL